MQDLICRRTCQFVTGAVQLARRLALDRDVAYKTLCIHGAIGRLQGRVLKKALLEGRLVPRPGDRVRPFGFARMSGFTRARALGHDSS